MRILGIDPGFDGGAATVADNGVLVDYNPMPILRETVGKKKKRVIKSYDLNGLKKLIGAERPYTLVVIEKIQTRPGQNVASVGKYMEGFGLLQGLCFGMGRSYVLVRPQDWKKQILVGYDRSKKESSVLYVYRRWPLSDLRGNKDQIHGQADAICMALYGEWLYNNGGA